MDDPTLYRLEVKIDKLLENDSRLEAQHSALGAKVDHLSQHQDDQEVRLRKLEVSMAKIIAWASLVAAGGASFTNWMLH